ncbi:MAG: hypothetical protein D6705_12410 [Deltaproteobacteria bacterium]|nr:MAG: hypothetical protein D6705_12410 [Deltaproteobacteria bacterium]
MSRRRDASTTDKSAPPTTGRLRWFVHVALLAAACRPPAGPVRPAATASQPRSNRPTQRPPTAREGDDLLRIEIRGDLDAGIVRVVTTIPPGFEPTEFAAPAPHLVAESLRLEDRSGPVPFELTSTEAGLRVRTGRPLESPATLSYALRPDDAPVPLHDLRVTPTAAFVKGEALLLPVAQGAVPKANAAIAPCGPARRAASTLALVDGPVPLHLVRRADFSCGFEWTVRFEEFAGALDLVAAEGHLPFDVRWAAAEIAVLRSAVDLRLGSTTPAPFVTLLRMDDLSPPAPELVWRLRARGMTLAVGRFSTWDDAMRIDVATALVQRWLAGRFPLDPPPEEVALAPTWWTVGLARFVAMEILAEEGLLGTTAYAAALDEAELEVARPSSPGPARRLARSAASGLLFALAADRHLRARGFRGGIPGLVAEVIADHQTNPRRGIRWEAWIDALEGRGGPELRRRFEEMLRDGRRPQIPRDALAPCLLPRVRTTTLWDPGLFDPRTAARGFGTVEGLDPDGAAAAAGVRAGDVIRAFEIASEKTPPRVRLEVERDGEVESFDFPARRVSVRHVEWIRPRNAPVDRCGPPS